MFTKYDQFLRNVKMDVLDYPDKYLDRSVSEVANERFQEQYLHPLGEDVEYVRLNSEWHVIYQDHYVEFFLEELDISSSHCSNLIVKTEQILDSTIALHSSATTAP